MFIQAGAFIQQNMVVPFQKRMDPNFISPSLFVVEIAFFTYVIYLPCDTHSSRRVSLGK